MILALIGVVRYCKVVPWTERSLKFSEKQFYSSVAVVFLVAVVFASLPIFVPMAGQYRYSPSRGVCFTDWRQENEIFRTLFYVLVIGMAFPVLSVCYVMLFKSLREHNKRISVHMAPKINATVMSNTKGADKDADEEGRPSPREVAVITHAPDGDDKTEEYSKKISQGSMCSLRERFMSTIRGRSDS